MAKHRKVSNCRSRRSDGRRGDQTKGMVLVIVMMVATLLLIALTATLPSVYQEGQREREAELIFRGTQYARAVALFHRQFNRYPVSTKELLQTNGMRFLRSEYRDPMDPKGKWRFIHVSAAGVLLDSVNQRLTGNQNNPAGVGGNNSQTLSQTSSMLGGSSSSGFSMSSGLQTNSADTGANSPTESTSQIGPTSSFFGNQGQMGGAYIAGVAATSKHESIQIWHKYRHYNQWEFIGLDMGVFGIQVGMPGGSTGPTGVDQQSTPQSSGFSLGSSTPSSPGTSSPSSFGPSSN